MTISEQIYNTYLKNNTNQFYYPYYKNEIIETFDYILSHITYTEDDMYMWLHNCTDGFIEHQYDIYDTILNICASINNSVKQLPSYIKNIFYKLKSFCVSTCHNHFYIDNVNNFEWGVDDNDTIYVGHIFKKKYLLYTPLKDISYMYKGSARIRSLLNKSIPYEQIDIINNTCNDTNIINYNKCINDIIKLYVYCVCLGFSVKEKDVKKIKKLFE